MPQLDIVDIKSINFTKIKTLKVCLKCKINKSRDEFQIIRRSAIGRGMLLSSECKLCRNKYYRDVYEKNRFKETSKQRTNNGVIIGGKKVCSRCHVLLEVSEFGSCNITKSGLASSCKKCKVLIGYIENRKLKQEMVDAYGGGCSCCGIIELEFLTVEHIFGDGKEHRALVNGHGASIYRDLKRKRWPKGRHTVMCRNCNCARKYNRPCLHNEKEYNKWLLSLESYVLSSKSLSGHT